MKLSEKMRRCCEGEGLDYLEEVRALEARIEKLQADVALWHTLASPIWRGDESEGYFQCLCCNEIGMPDEGAGSIKHLVSCEYALALTRPKENESAQCR